MGRWVRTMLLPRSRLWWGCGPGHSHPGGVRRRHLNVLFITIGRGESCAGHLSGGTNKDDRLCVAGWSRWWTTPIHWKNHWENVGLWFSVCLCWGWILEVDVRGVPGEQRVEGSARRCQSSWEGWRSFTETVVARSLLKVQERTWSFALAIPNEGRC